MRGPSTADRKSGPHNLQRQLENFLEGVEWLGLTSEQRLLQLTQNIPFDFCIVPCHFASCEPHAHDSLPRMFLSSWVDNKRPRQRPQFNYGHGLGRDLRNAGVHIMGAGELVKTTASVSNC